VTPAFRIITNKAESEMMADAYAKLPKPVMLPRQAFQKLMAGDAELVPLNKIANRVVGVGVIPCPPGIPIVMPGESIGPANGGWISYLKALQHWARAFRASPRKWKAPSRRTAPITSTA
jgi:arginine decarboxylase